MLFVIYGEDLKLTYNKYLFKFLYLNTSYLSSNATIPGNSFPSKNSSEAPPPVEM